MNSQITIPEVDLHNHTTFSDGEYTPEELVLKAQELGIKAIAITDHDTVKGIPAALKTGDEIGVEVVPGLELTLRFVEPYFRGSLHLLLYFHRDLLKSEEFLAESAEVLSLGRGPALNSARLDAINTQFGPDGVDPQLPRFLTVDDLYKHGQHISRRHFAMALNDLGIAEKAQVSEIIGNDSPAYIPSGVPLESVSEFVQKWPLVRVFAHPAAGSFPGEGHYKEVLPPFETVEKLLPRFVEAGLDGMEVFYPGHTREWEKRLQQKIQDLGLTIQTGGSDCHDKVNRRLGIRGLTYSAYEPLKKLMETRLHDWMAAEK